ncbi:hypothetical protein PIB30_066503 [Stylosanthes scabra]|uniref:Uncharacterized protein n=1 Tax=Stylosanthes scabra TaxID=79078 RepID=A0ABU6VN92_9FABA|nr:hypothetical protein [Stylosanthes scabra]
MHQVTGSRQNHPEKGRKVGRKLASLAQKPQAPEWGQCYGPASKAQIIKESQEYLNYPQLYKQGASPSQDKIPLQFEEVFPSKAESESSVKKGEKASDASVITKKTPSSTKILQESEKYVEWMQIDFALMTWLDASMSITYQNRVMHCAIFTKAWETITYIFTASSSIRIQSVKTQLRATKKTGTINEYLQAIQSW